MSTKKLQILDYNIKQAENADTVDGKHANEFYPAQKRFVFGGDYNSLMTNGIYELLGTSERPTQNAPNGNNSNNDYYVQVFAHSANYITQIATSGRRDKTQYIRSLSNGVWDSWEQIKSGDADTVDGKHASDFAAASDVSDLQVKVGDTLVSEQISTAISEIDYPVDSVNGKTGAVMLTANDVGALPVDTEIPSISGLATETYVDSKVAGIVDSAPETLNTLNELSAALGDDPNFATTIATQIGGKVDKVSGKGLSTNDYTTGEKNKLAGIAAGANKTTVDTALSTTSTNPVQNKVVTTQINNLNTLVGDITVSDQISTAIADKVDKVSGKGLSTNDYTTAEKNKLSGIASGAEVNQNAFSNVIVGSTTVAADTAADTLTLVAGNNVTLTPDAKNDKITIAAKDTTYSAATTSAAGLMSASDKTKLNGIATGATKITVDSALSSTSTNPVQNKVVNTAISNLNTLVGDMTVSEQISAATDECITGMSVSGKTVTYTKKDGSTGSITTQDTDTKVTSKTENPKSSFTYYPTWVTGATTGEVLVNDGIRYSTLQGTTDTNGYGALSLGNGRVSGTEGNKTGAVRIFGTGAYYGQIVQKAGLTTNVNHVLPTTEGTILNTGTTSFTPFLTSGTAIGTLKINDTSTTLYAPTNDNSNWGNTYITNADEAPLGFSRISNDGTNNPFIFWCTLLTTGANDTTSYRQQWAFPWGDAEATTQAPKYRVKDNGNWGNWTSLKDGGNANTVGGIAVTKLKGNDTKFIYTSQNGSNEHNLTEFKEEGHYFVFNYNDSPTNFGFLDISVFDGSGFTPMPNGIIRQSWTDYIDPSKNYMRIYNSTSATEGSWTDWKRISDSDSAYLPLTGGNMTGNINIKSNTTNCVTLGRHTASGSGDAPYGYINLYNRGSIVGNIYGSNVGLIVRPMTNNTGSIGESSHYFDNAYINNLDKVTMIKGSGDTYHRAERTDLTFKDSNGDTQHEDIRFGISAAGNRGIWDRRSGSWLTYFVAGSNDPVTKGAFTAQEGKLTLNGTETFTSEIPFSAGRNYMYIYTSRIPKLFNKIQLVNNKSEYLTVVDHVSLGYTIVNTTTKKYIKLKTKYSGSGTPTNPSWDYIVFFCTL